MPRPLKPRKRGQPRQQAEPRPELVTALSVAGINRHQIAHLLGLSVAVVERRYAGYFAPGHKMPVFRVAGLVQRLLDLAETAQTPADIPHVVAVVRLLAGLHLPELARSWQPPKEADADLPPISPTIGYAEAADAITEGRIRSMMSVGD